MPEHEKPEPPEEPRPKDAEHVEFAHTPLGIVTTSAIGIVLGLLIIGVFKAIF